MGCPALSNVPLHPPLLYDNSDSADWKAYHHDSAAFNPKRAKNQNITVGVSFGATRELSFLRAYNNENNAAPQQHNPVRMYFPQTNNGVFTFGRDVNIQWKHGVNALPSEEHDGKGRISIILWGLAKNVIEEEGSPPLLGSDGQGPHANSNKNKNNGRHNKKRRNNHHAQNMKRRNNVKDNHNNPRGEKDKKNGRPQEKK